ncbi:MAG: DUF4861 family protein [Prevotella sp.]|nr:DUF4861 family protein [Candidatus Equicola stercoris]
MKKGFLLFICILCMALNCYADVVVTVTNKTKVQRQEIVEIDAQKVCDKLGVAIGKNFIVINALNQEVGYQITYDKKILLDVAVRPLGHADFTITKGTPRATKTFVQGRQYPERVDDIAWENDRGAYRLYGPALQKSGEQAFGNDVWAKNTPDLEVEKRYKTELENHPKIQELLKEGKQEEALAMEESTTYHFDHGYGLDCYKVGPSLGCGTPALMTNGEIKYPYCYKNYNILDNGPLRFTVELTYNEETLPDGTRYVEHRLMSCDKGSNFNKLTVWYEGLKKDIEVCAGVVVHNEDTETMECGKGYAIYADPTDNPTKQNFQIYTGVIFTDKNIKTEFVTNGANANKEKGIAGHVIGHRKLHPNEKFTYWFGSAWSKYDVRNFDEWKLRTHTTMDAITAPLQVKIVDN